MFNQLLGDIQLHLRSPLLAFLLILATSLFSGHAQSVSYDGSSVSAPQFDVPDWNDQVSDARLVFQTFRSATLNDPDLSVDQKLEAILAKRDEMQDDFKSERRSLYEAFRLELSRGHSCTKGNSGGSTKKCGDKCISASNAALFTRPEWVQSWKADTEKPADELPSITGPRPRSKVVELIRDNGRTICTVNLRKSGKGRLAALIRGTFRIRGAAITELVAAEADAYIKLVTASPT